MTTGGGRTIRQPNNNVHTTLGDLIVAIMDEVAPLTRNTGKTYVLVSCVLQALLDQRRVRLVRKLLPAPMATWNI